MPIKQLNKVKHDYIRYANCWEDADILLEGLQIQPEDQVLSIGSAGDNSFSLLLNNPKQVVAVDINQVQLNLIHLKKAAFIHLDYNDFLAFLGFRKSKDRLVFYKQVKLALSEELQEFWDSRLDEIDAGIIYQGKFENYFKMFRSRVLPLIHSEKRINRLLQKKDNKAQESFFNKHWNNRRWRLLFKVFFSKFVMGRLGRDPKFLEQVKVNVANFILEKAKKHLSSVQSQTNYFLQFILKGRFDTELPHYARKENFEIIKKNVIKLTIFKGLAEEAFVKYKHFNKFNLSNIFEYMDEKTFHQVASELAAKSDQNSIFCYWNLMVPHQLSGICSSINYNEKLSVNLAERDKGFFYSNVIIETKNG